jgi:hypothetical protein
VRPPGQRVRHGLREVVRASARQLQPALAAAAPQLAHPRPEQQAEGEGTQEVYDGCGAVGCVLPAEGEQEQHEEAGL